MEKVFIVQNQKTSVMFDKERAAAYDKSAAKFAPLGEALHFLIRLILADLPKIIQQRLIKLNLC